MEEGNRGGTYVHITISVTCVYGIKIGKINYTAYIGILPIHTALRPTCENPPFMHRRCVGHHRLPKQNQSADVCQSETKWDTSD